MLLWGGTRLRPPGAPVVGLLGCMASRLKDRLFQHGLVDLVAGPDAYRDLPRLLQAVQVILPSVASISFREGSRLCLCLVPPFFGGGGSHAGTV